MKFYKFVLFKRKREGTGTDLWRKMQNRKGHQQQEMSNMDK